MTPARKAILHAGVGKEFRRHRVGHGLSLAELAKQTGAGAAQLNNIENGAPCPLWILVQVAAVYDVGLHALVPVHMARAT